MGERTNERTNGRTDVRADGQTDGRWHERTDERRTVDERAERALFRAFFNRTAPRRVQSHLRHCGTPCTRHCGLISATAERALNFRHCGTRLAVNHRTAPHRRPQRRLATATAVSCPRLRSWDSQRWSLQSQLRLLLLPQCQSQLRPALPTAETSAPLRSQLRPSLQSQLLTPHTATAVFTAGRSAALSWSRSTCNICRCQARRTLQGRHLGVGPLRHAPPHHSSPLS